MREIKFRGKRIDNGEWVYGGFYRGIMPETENPFSLDNARIKKIIIQEGIYYHVNLDTVGQYTGIKDINGKEIYEGDITVATYGKHYNEPKGLTRICKVIYDAKTCSFRMAVNNSKVLVSFGDSRSKDIEIIGTIHDNPELLGDQAE